MGNSMGKEWTRDELIKMYRADPAGFFSTDPLGSGLSGKDYQALYNEFINGWGKAKSATTKAKTTKAKTTKKK